MLSKTSEFSIKVISGFSLGAVQEVRSGGGEEIKTKEPSGIFQDIKVKTDIFSKQPLSKSISAKNFEMYSNIFFQSSLYRHINHIFHFQ